MPGFLSRKFSTLADSKPKREAPGRAQANAGVQVANQNAMRQNRISPEPAMTNSGFRVIRKGEGGGERAAKPGTTSFATGPDRRDSPTRWLSAQYASGGPYPTPSTSRFSDLAHSASATPLVARSANHARPMPNPRRPSRAYPELYSHSLPTPSPRFPSRRIADIGDIPTTSSFLENPAVDRYPRPFITPKTEFTNPSINGLNPSRGNSRSGSMTSDFISNYSLEGVEGFPASTPSPRPRDDGGTTVLLQADGRRRINSTGPVPIHTERAFRPERPGDGSTGTGRQPALLTVSRVPSPIAKSPARLLVQSPRVNCSNNYSQYSPTSRPSHATRRPGPLNGFDSAPEERMPSGRSIPPSNRSIRPAGPAINMNRGEELRRNRPLKLVGDGATKITDQYECNIRRPTELRFPSDELRRIPPAIPTPSLTSQASSSPRDMSSIEDKPEQQQWPARSCTVRPAGANIAPAANLSTPTITVIEGENDSPFDEVDISPSTPISAPATPIPLSTAYESPSLMSNIALVRQVMRSTTPIMPGPRIDKCYYRKLTIIQEQCIMGHNDKVLKRTENLHHRVGCMICGVAPEADGVENETVELEMVYLWMCSWCALRICGNCKAALREEQSGLGDNFSPGIRNVDLKALGEKILGERARKVEQSKLHNEDLAPALEVNVHPQPEVYGKGGLGQDALAAQPMLAGAEEETNCSEAAASEVYRTANSTPLIPNPNQLDEQKNMKPASIACSVPPVNQIRPRDSGFAIRGDSQESVYTTPDPSDDGSKNSLLLGSGKENVLMKERKLPLKETVISTVKQDVLSTSMPEEKPIKLVVGPQGNQNAMLFLARKSSLAPALQRGDKRNALERNVVEETGAKIPVDQFSLPEPILELSHKQEETYQDDQTPSEHESLHDQALSALLSSSLAVLYNLDAQPQKNAQAAKETTVAELTRTTSSLVLPVVTAPSSPIGRKAMHTGEISAAPVPPKSPVKLTSTFPPSTVSPISPGKMVKRKPIINPPMNDGDENISKGKNQRNGSSLSGVFSLDKIKSKESNRGAFSALNFASRVKNKGTSTTNISSKKPGPILLPPLEFERSNKEADITMGLFGHNGALGVGIPGSPERATAGLDYATGINGLPTTPLLYSPIGQMMGNSGPLERPMHTGRTEKNIKWFKGYLGRKS